MTPYEKLKLLREKVSTKGNPIDKQHIINNLKEVYDPEMSGVSVYELGLIYDIDIQEDSVKITHTLTSAFCPYADEIIENIKQAGYVPDVIKVEIETTFDPPFSYDNLSEEAKLTLGLDDIEWEWDYITPSKGKKVRFVW